METKTCALPGCNQPVPVTPFTIRGKQEQYHSRECVDAAIGVKSKTREAPTATPQTKVETIAAGKTRKTVPQTKPAATSPQKGTQPLVALIASRGGKALDLESTYKGTNLTATIDKNAKVIFEGKSYDSLSVAAGMARKKVLKAKEPPATNGWTFWLYRDATGKLHEVSDLRT